MKHGCKLSKVPFYITRKNLIDHQIIFQTIIYGPGHVKSTQGLLKILEVVRTIFNIFKSTTNNYKCPGCTASLLHWPSSGCDQWLAITASGSLPGRHHDSNNSVCTSVDASPNQIGAINTSDSRLPSVLQFDLVYLFAGCVGRVAVPAFCGPVYGRRGMRILFLFRPLFFGKLRIFTKLQKQTL